MTTYGATAAFAFAAQDALTTEDLESLPMTVVLIEVREPLWITLTEVTN